MSSSSPTRRRVLSTLGLTGAAAILPARRAWASEETLETTTVRLKKSAAICVAPQYIAEDLLRAEGFTDIHYIDGPTNFAGLGEVTGGRIDFDVNYAANFVAAIDAGQPLTVLAGIMVGCFELFARDNISGIADLKGRSVGMLAMGSLPHMLLTLMAAQVGLDPAKDIRWVTDPKAKPIELFVDGKIDAFLGFPPEPQDLRARHFGHVLVNTATDGPWSQYFCCMLGCSREYAQKYPVATKRVLRAVLKATDLCANDPIRAARRLVDGGFTSRYDYALQTLNENPYNKWRQFDAEDTLRFYALRLREVGFIKSTPQKIIAENADWRFLNELRRELKT